MRYREHRSSGDLRIYDMIERLDGDAGARVPILDRQKIRRDADVLEIRFGDLLKDARVLCFASEPSELESSATTGLSCGHKLRCAHPVRSAGDSIAVAVGRVGERENRRLGNRLDESHAEHGRRESRGNSDARRNHFGFRAGNGLVLDLWSAECAEEVVVGAADAVEGVLEKST